MANLVKCSPTALLKRNPIYLDGFLRTQKAALSGVEFCSQNFYLLPSAVILIKTQSPLGRGTRWQLVGWRTHLYL